MKQFTGVLRHEFNMSIRRPALWIGFGLLYAFYGVALLTPSMVDTSSLASSSAVWQFAGRNMFTFNMFMALLAGILASDRMQRDERLQVRELQQSTPLSRLAYVLSKYTGVLLSVCLPVLLWMLFYSLTMIGLGQASLSLIPASLAAFLLIGVPSLAFVTAFSLACPLFMPVRVYQILFTGYWFWGNYLSPKAFPTISETILSACGKYAMDAFFHVTPLGQHPAAVHPAGSLAEYRRAGRFGRPGSCWSLNANSPGNPAAHKESSK